MLWFCQLARVCPLKHTAIQTRLPLTLNESIWKPSQGVCLSFPYFSSSEPPPACQAPCPATATVPSHAEAEAAGCRDAAASPPRESGAKTFNTSVTGCQAPPQPQGGFCKQHLPTVLGAAKRFQSVSAFTEKLLSLHQSRKSCCVS